MAEELRKLMVMRTRVFVVHMEQELGSVLFVEVAKLGMMGGGYVWIMTTGITMELGLMDPNVLGGGSMEGVLGVRPLINTSKVFDEFAGRWKVKFQRDYPEEGGVEPNAFEFWAYDTVFALAEAVEIEGRLANFDFGISDSRTSFTSLTELGVSLAGPKLLGSISRTDFDGASGRFQLVEGQLEVIAFELINVVGNEIKRIGFWTPSNGISEHMNDTSTIEGILWPGKLKEAPRGWEWPTEGRKLRIGVPLANGLLEFTDVRYDPRHNTTIVRGFCIEVFEAAIAKLKYDVPREYVLYVDKHGNSNGTHDDLVYQVYLKNFDAVVGDVTICSNRSMYVDFTTPYTESGVIMIVAIKGRPQSIWSFLEPMTCPLWLVSGAAFFFTGLVIWLLEHENNEELNGSLARQLGIVFYFSFSTMVFAHKLKLSRNFSRTIVIIWVLVVLVLTSSYTASLSSMLTSQQLKPIFTDGSDLIHRGEQVGYSGESFVKSLLVNLGFMESNLIAYNSPKEYAEALSKGSDNGGVAAVFDEIPYVRSFLSKYTNYTVAGPTYKSAGFGFVFPKGSPLLSDISDAILAVKEGDEMLVLEKKLYGNLSYVPLSLLGDQGAPNVSNKLSFEGFIGLFIITGFISTVSLLLHQTIFLCKHRKKFISKDLSFGGKLIAFIKLFNERDEVSSNGTPSLTDASTYQKVELQTNDKNLPTPPCADIVSRCPSSFSCHAELDTYIEEGIMTPHEDLAAPNSDHPSAEIAEKKP